MSYVVGTVYCIFCRSRRCSFPIGSRVTTSQTGAASYLSPEKAIPPTRGLDSRFSHCKYIVHSVVHCLWPGFVFNSPFRLPLPDNRNNPQRCHSIVSFDRGGPSTIAIANPVLQALFVSCPRATRARSSSASRPTVLLMLVPPSARARMCKSRYTAARRCWTPASRRARPLSSIEFSRLLRSKKLELSVALD